MLILTPPFVLISFVVIQFLIHGAASSSSISHFINRADLSWKALETAFSTSSQGIYWNDLSDHPNRKIACLWPHTQIMLAALDNIDAGGNKSFIDAHVGLQSYKLVARGYPAYAPVVHAKTEQGRFFDDNGVTGIVLIRAAKILENLREELLQQIEEIWPFIETALAKDGGVFWLELDPKPNRGICSTGSTSELGLRLLLFSSSGDSKNNDYLAFAEKNIEWINSHLLDNSTSIYWNSWYEKISDVPSTCTTGTNVCNWLFTYNQGYVINMLVLLFHSTGDRSYLDLADRTAKASLTYFTPEVVWKQPPAFNAIYFRACILLNEEIPDPRYLTLMRNYLDLAWDTARDQDSGLFVLNGIGTYDREFGSIDQAAFVQMYVMISKLNIL